MQDVFKQAKENMSICKMCKICNGEVCRGWIPGPGGKGSGQTFVNNVQSLKQYRLNQEVIREDYEVDTSFKLFNQTYSSPIMIAPIASVLQHYGTEMDEDAYARAINDGAKKANILPFFGDGVHPRFFESGAKAINQNNYGIATIKPWRLDIVKQKMDLIQEHSSLGIAMDVDASGLVFLKDSDTPIQFKTVEDLKQIKDMINGPFIIKGIMSTSDAQKAIDAGADAIIVSNHGGRIMDEGMASIDVLEEIVNYVSKACLVFTDGGYRSGFDVFKALALGADGVLIGRPFSHAAIGGGSEGVFKYAEKLNAELKEAMRLTSSKNLKAIVRSKVTKV